MLISKYFALLASAGLLMLCAGCSDGLASLEGAVTIDGQPAPKGLSLQFTPLAPGGSPSYASVDANGHYEAAFTFQKTGIQPGEHLVKLVPGGVETPMPVIGPDGKPKAPVRNLASELPAEYYQQIQTIEVGPGNNVIDIPLSTKK